MKRRNLVAIVVVVLAAIFATVMFTTVNRAPTGGDGNVDQEVINDTDTAAPVGNDPAQSP